MQNPVLDALRRPTFDQGPGQAVSADLQILGMNELLVGSADHLIDGVAQFDLPGRRDVLKASLERQGVEDLAGILDVGPEAPSHWPPAFPPPACAW